MTTRRRSSTDDRAHEFPGNLLPGRVGGSGGSGGSGRGGGEEEEHFLSNLTMADTDFSGYGCGYPTAVDGCSDSLGSSLGGRASASSLAERRVPQPVSQQPLSLVVPSLQVLLEALAPPAAGAGAPPAAGRTSSSSPAGSGAGPTAEHAASSPEARPGGAGGIASSEEEPRASVDDDDDEHLQTLHRRNDLFNLTEKVLVDIERMAMPPPPPEKKDGESKDSKKEKDGDSTGSKSGKDDDNVGTAKEPKSARGRAKGGRWRNDDRSRASKLRQLEESQFKRRQMEQQQEKQEQGQMNIDDDANHDGKNEAEKKDAAGLGGTTDAATTNEDSREQLDGHDLLSASQRTQCTFNSIAVALQIMVPMVTHSRCRDAEDVLENRSGSSVGNDGGDKDGDDNCGTGTGTGEVKGEGGLEDENRDGVKTEGAGTNAGDEVDGNLDNVKKGQTDDGDTDKGERKKKKKHKRKKQKKKCYLIGRYVYGPTTANGLDSLIRKMRDILSCLGYEGPIESLNYLGKNEYSAAAGSCTGASADSTDSTVDSVMALFSPMLDRHRNVTSTVDGTIDATLGIFLGTGQDSAEEGATATSQHAIEIVSEIDRQIIVPISSSDPHLNNIHLASIDRLHTKLSSAIRSQYPTAKLTIYGSCLSGLSLGKNSDVDISLYLPDAHHLKSQFDAGHITAAAYEKGMKNYVYKIKRLIDRRGNGSLVDLFAVHHARIPVVKGRDINARCPYSDDGSLCFDICFLNDIAVANSSLIGEYARLDERVRQLMLAIKSWVKQKKIGSAAEGTLSSYSWMVLVIFYLQVIGFVPNLQDEELMRTHGIVVDPRRNPSHGVNGLNTAFLVSDRILRSNHWKRNYRVDELPVSVLLLGFFKYYSEVFPSSLAAVSIRLGKCELQKTSFARSARLWRMCIEDPFETYFSHTPHDLGIHLDQKGQSRVSACLSEACAQMEMSLKQSNSNAAYEIISSLLLRGGTSRENDGNGENKNNAGDNGRNQQGGSRRRRKGRQNQARTDAAPKYHQQDGKAVDNGLKRHGTEKPNTTEKQVAGSQRKSSPSRRRGNNPRGKADKNGNNYQDQDRGQTQAPVPEENGGHTRAADDRQGAGGNRAKAQRGHRRRYRGRGRGRGREGGGRGGGGR